MKRVISMVLCLLLVLSLAPAAFADSTTQHTITINNATSDYEYAAYQIFKGDLVDGQLTNIAWGSGIDSAEYTELMTALSKITAFADCKTVVDVAAALGKITDEDNAVTVAFADVVSKYLSSESKTSTYADNKYTINVTGDGYYMVKNTKVPAATDSTATGAYTRYILQVVGDVSVSHKGKVPDVTKKIVEDDQEVDANTAGIGETVNYKFTGSMPSNIADYDTYYYLFTDTMSDGLTYTNTVKVTVNGVDVTKYFYKNATTNQDGTTTLKVGIQDILALENLVDPSVGTITANTKVVVTYTAMVNEKANIGVDGETNKVKLTFSNDPNEDGDGANNPPEENPGEPTPSHPAGETPEDVVKTYTTEIKITKVDGLNENQTLTGAKFSISGHSSKVMLVNKEMFVEDEDGAYYRLKDGTYTTTEPVFTDNNPNDETNPVNSQYYDLEDGSTAKKYKKVETLSTETITTPFEAEGWVDENGVITFTGLGEGTYTITELVAPDGYNKLKKPIQVVITSNAASLTINSGTETVTWSATVDGDNATINNGVIEMKVENTSGSTLPSTGGMGTTLFYVFGSILVLAAVVLLVTKKRMSIAE